MVLELVLLQHEYVRDISHGLKCNSHTRDVDNISLPLTLDRTLIHSLRIFGFCGKVNNENFLFFSICERQFITQHLTIIVCILR